MNAPCRHPIQCIVPPYMVEHMARSADPKIRERALVDLARSSAVRAVRTFSQQMPTLLAHRQPPPRATDPCLADLSARITWLEHHLDASGSIVAKQPDVWGQSRLTRHRVDYEQQMQRQLGAFTERTSAAIRRSDQAFTGLALAMQSASGRRRPTSWPGRPEPTSC